MDFRTKIPQVKPGISLSYKDRIFVMGSCFAENIGSKLDDSGFRVMLNPYGVLYNPSSVSYSIRRLLSKEPFKKNELVELDGLFHSFNHHGSFSGADAEKVLSDINLSFEKSSKFLSEASCIMLTFGTAWIYALPENGKVVANCHKFPSSRFNRYRLTIEKIVEDYYNLIDSLIIMNPNIKILLTVSPIRHLRDGFHENTSSKAILHLAVDEICSAYQNVFYFPSYELMIDDLRDYRFYDEDMLHISRPAKDYIWDYFTETILDKSSREIIKQVQQIHKAMEHRPLHDNDEAYSRFAQKNIATIEVLKSRVPELDLTEEKCFFEKILGRVTK
jgi:hypothetical protein